MSWSSGTSSNPPLIALVVQSSWLRSYHAAPHSLTATQWPEAAAQLQLRLKRPRPAPSNGLWGDVAPSQVCRTQWHLPKVPRGLYGASLSAPSSVPRLVAGHYEKRSDAEEAGVEELDPIALLAVAVSGLAVVRAGGGHDNHHGTGIVLAPDSFCEMPETYLWSTSAILPCADKT